MHFELKSIGLLPNNFFLHLGRCLSSLFYNKKYFIGNPYHHFPMACDTCYLTSFEKDTSEKKSSKDLKSFVASGLPPSDLKTSVF